MNQAPDNDPERLELSDPTLKRALAALAEDGPNPLELQRMRQRLLGVFQTPAPARTSMLKFVGWAVAALSVGLGLAVLIGLAREPEVAEPSHVDAARGATEDEFAAPRAEDAVAEPVPMRTPPTELAPSSAPSEVVRPAPERFTTIKPRPARPAVVRSYMPSEATLVAAPSGEAIPAADDKSEALPTAPVVQEPRAEPAPRPAAPAPLDEASLLQRARELAGSDPVAALRFLNEHKLRFAHGMLSPEREVLAIELLRALSRQREAARRLSAFRRDFPDSVYLQRFDP